MGCVFKVLSLIFLRLALESSSHVGSICSVLRRKSLLESLGVQLEPEPEEDEADDCQWHTQDQPVGEVDGVGLAILLVQPVNTHLLLHTLSEPSHLSS